MGLGPGAGGLNQRLSLDRVVAAAIELADTEGISALSMARPADRLAASRCRLPACRQQGRPAGFYDRRGFRSRPTRADRNRLADRASALGERADDHLPSSPLDTVTFLQLGHHSNRASSPGWSPLRAQQDTALTPPRSCSWFSLCWATSVGSAIYRSGPSRPSLDAVVRRHLGPADRREFLPSPGQNSS